MRTDTGVRRDVTTPGVKCTLSMISRAGRTTLAAGIEILPLARRIWPSGPAGVVVVVAVVAVVVDDGVEVDVDVELDVVVVVELDVELEVVPVDVESVLLVVSARTLSGPAKPALAKYPSSANAASAHAAASVFMKRLFTEDPL
jgi:predicted anti-sigma-YlaC factor YlaD